jgi:hypothetical protein
MKRSALRTTSVKLDGLPVGIDDMKQAWQQQHHEI